MNIKDYLKDKIDWKFFNALMDKLTKYEDRGIDCSLTVYLYSRKTRLRLVEYSHYKLLYSSLVSTDVERIIERGMHMMTYTIKMDDKKAQNTRFKENNR